MQQERSYQPVMSKLAIILLIAALTIVATYMIVTAGDKTGVLVPGAVIGFAIITYSFINIKFGFYASVITGFLIFILARLLGEDLPWGSLVELQIMTTFVGLIVLKILKKEPLFAGANHPITYGYLVYTLFLLIEVFNPSMHSFEGWVFVFRKFLQFLMIYFICLELFRSIADIRSFLVFIIACMTIAAVYGCYQEWFGLFKFEMDWIFSVPGRAGLYSLDNGNFRKFSLLSDPAAFGIVMAAGALLTLILGFGAKKFSRKAMLLVSSTFMFLAMAYSGTRTAYSIIPAGVILFVLMTITRRNTLIFACFFLAVFVVIIWGPIYGNPTINRIRSTFEFSEEASMKVRDINRKNIQPYIYTHPIGGGLATSGMQGLEYNPSHYLAGFPPDSGFLRTAVETGWIGLALQCLLYFIIIQSGVRVFYQANDKKTRMYALAITIPLFCFIVAQYAQVSIGQIPGCFVFYPGLAMIARLKNFISDQQVNQKQLI